MHTPTPTDPRTPPRLRRRAIDVLAVLLIAAIPFAFLPAVARAAVPALELADLPSDPVALPDGWTVRACEGDAPLICTEEAGTPQGVVEHSAFPLDSFPQLSADIGSGTDVRTALVRQVDDLHAGVRADRLQVCGDGFEYVAAPTHGAVLAGLPAVQYGYDLLALPERRVVERVVGLIGVRGQVLDVLTATELDEGSCESPEGAQPFTDGGLGRFTPNLVQLAARLDVGALSRPLPAVAADRRLTADDAVATAIALSRLALPDPAPGGTVLIARDDDVADALASGPAQGVLDAPLLLTPTGSLDPRVAEEVGRLGATRALVLGGPAAVSPQVVAELEALDLAVDRIAGADRIATALAIADRVTPEVERVVLARAFGDADDPTRAYADALAAGALAASEAVPVLLTPTEALDPRVADWVEDRGVEQAVLAGGEQALGQPVRQAVVEAGAGLEVAAGASRAETAVLLSRVRDLPSAAYADAVVLVDSTTWVDGVASALLAARTLSPVLLASGDGLDLPTEAFLAGADPADPPRLVCTPSVTDAACDAASAALRSGV